MIFASAQLPVLAVPLAVGSRSDVAATGPACTRACSTRSDVADTPDAVGSTAALPAGGRTQDIDKMGPARRYNWLLVSSPSPRSFASLYSTVSHALWWVDQGADAPLVVV
jgi:hypothetical protein